MGEFGKEGRRNYERVNCKVGSRRGQMKDITRKVEKGSTPGFITLELSTFAFDF